MYIWPRDSPFRVWIRPELVAEVKFQGWTNERIMRAPIFLRSREDKSPNECRIETEAHLTEVIQDTGTDIVSGTTNIGDQSIDIPSNNTTTTTTTTVTTTTNKRSFSNLDKIFWNKTKDHLILTKRDLIDYYDRSRSSLQ